MAHRPTLTQAQLDLLGWIADGCPEGVVEGESYRISAAALRRRGLVKTRERGADWSAEITPRGRATGPITTDDYAPLPAPVAQPRRHGLRDPAAMTAAVVDDGDEPQRQAAPPSQPPPQPARQR